MMLSSPDVAADSIRCRELGLARYISKPVTCVELRESILFSLGFATIPERAEGTAQSRGQTAAAGTRVLLAEDNLTNQKLAVRLLSKRGYTVVVAGDGLLALEELRNRDFDLVLMDIQMPHMSGYEATAAIREIEKSTGRRTPIIALTAHAMRGDVESCLQAGMDDHVAKPIQANDLFRKIEKFLSGSGTPEACPVDEAVSVKL